MRKQVTGWGHLRNNIRRLKHQIGRIEKAEEKLVTQKEEVSVLFQGLDELRRTRVIELLESDNTVICLTHSMVFRQSTIRDLLVFRDFAKVVKIKRSWQIKEQCYDVVPTCERYSDSFRTIACARCRNVLSRAQVKDELGRSCSLWTEDDDQLVSAEFKSFYSTKIIDLISEKYFGMDPVTMNNIRIL